MHRLDGAPKDLTADCATCVYHVRGEGAGRLRERVKVGRQYAPLVGAESTFCGWGVVLKTLVLSPRPRACGLLGRPASGKNAWLELAHGVGPARQRDLFSEG